MNAPIGGGPIRDIFVQPRFDPWREMPPLWPEALLGPRPLVARSCWPRGWPATFPLPPFAHASLPGFFAIGRLSLFDAGECTMGRIDA